MSGDPRFTRSIPLTYLLRCVINFLTYSNNPSLGFPLLTQPLSWSRHGWTANRSRTVIPALVSRIAPS